MSSRSCRAKFKQFNFYTLGELQPSVPLREHLLDGNTVLHHIDPFFAECRAFGQLCEAGKDGALAVRCHGYAFLPPEIEARIAEKFGIEKWNRKAEHEGQPLRAIFKDIIRFKSPFGKTDFPADSPFGQRKFSEMRNNIEQINKLGILIMDVRKENFRCGRLFDFSAAITSPHIALDQNLRPKKAILKTMRFDLECFDSLLEKEMKQAKKAKKERERQAAKKAQEAKAVSLA